MMTNKRMGAAWVIRGIALLTLSALLTGCSSQVLEHDYEEPPYVDYSIKNTPEFVDDVSECKNTDKQYVLPDGYVYEYREVPVCSAINRLPLATDTDDSVFNGCGYKDNVRIRSVLEIGALEGCFVTGFIPVNKGDILYFSGNCFDVDAAEAHVMHTVFYNKDKQIVTSVTLRSATESFFEIVEKNEDGHISAVRISENVPGEGIAYIRLTLAGSGENQFISVNQPIVFSYGNYVWCPMAPYIPSDWFGEIKKTVETVSHIQLQSESPLVKFIFASDIHLDPDPSASYTENMGKVCAEVMRTCDIPFFASGGDSCTQSSGFMPSVFEGNMRDVLNQLSPIPQKNILLTVGNHDGATGFCEYNGEKLYYRFQLNNEERNSVFFDWQRESNEYKKFDSDGTYYYLDDSSTKTRYIVLNSFWSQWEGSEDGFVEDIQHSFFHTPMFGPQQLEWFATTALDMPPSYAAIIVTHHARPAMDFDIFKGIVDAFSHRTTYSGAYVGEEEWQSSDIAVNYEKANGEIIAVFQGHNHKDAKYDYFNNVPCINITTTGSFLDIRDEDATPRDKGTSSEFAVDVVTIDRKNRKIYMTRLGSGEDREIHY